MASANHHCTLSMDGNGVVLERYLGMEDAERCCQLGICGVDAHDSLHVEGFIALCQGN